MKRNIKFLTTGLLSLGLIFSLGSCSSGGSTSDYKKVKKAFEGVESSLKNQQKSIGKQALVPHYAINEGSSEAFESLETLFTQYSESRGDTIDELEYDQPPMIQFQCLKTVFESMGEGSFSFEKKYFDTITGNIYFDVNTGEAKSESDGEDYHFTYNFNLALGLKLDDDGLITADIGFDIGLTKGDDTYHVSWFVKMYLDYDFNDSIPTYTLLMLTDNEQTDLPYRLGVTYEYDYVKVNENKITEWRKFYYEMDQKLLHDSEHPSFDNYKDNVNYESGHLSWYKNWGSGRDLKKIKDLSGDKNYLIAKELFNLGLNTTDIPRENYFKEKGQQAEEISRMYQAFSNVVRKDLIYDLVASDGAPHDPSSGQYASIRLYFNGSKNVFDNVGCFDKAKDITFGDLFKADGEAYGGPDYPEIWYLDEHGGDVARETYFDHLKLFVIYGPDRYEVSFDDYVNVIFKGVDTESGSYDFALDIVYRNDENVHLVVHFTFNHTKQEAPDLTPYTIGIQRRDTQSGGQDYFSLVDNLKIKEFFLEGKHREYNEDTGGIDTVSNFKFVYYNQKGQTVGDVDFKDVTFGAKDFSFPESDYMYSADYAESYLPDIWFQVNSNYHGDAISFAAKVSTIEDKERQVCKFTISIKRDSAGEEIPLATALNQLWPTHPIEVAGFRDDLPYVKPSQNLDDNRPYDFYFDSSNTWMDMSVRLTSDEATAYVNSLTSTYGYKDNGMFSQYTREFIKPELRLTVGPLHDDPSSDVVKIELHRMPGKMIPEHLSFDSRSLPYLDSGYLLGSDQLCVGGISPEEAKTEEIVITYFENGSIAHMVKELGDHVITVEVRYPDDSQYMVRRITATITIYSAA